VGRNQSTISGSINSTTSMAQENTTPTINSSSSTNVNISTSTNVGLNETSSSRPSFNVTTIVSSTTNHTHPQRSNITGGFESSSTNLFSNGTVASTSQHFSLETSTATEFGTGSPSSTP